MFRVCLRVTARWPGQASVYERALERLGVRSEDLEDVRSELLGQFKRHALPYLCHPAFPQRLAEH
ncbi:MAG: hypothetical protein IH608_03125, partial [Proteobacteria bacterium]|nr:hypothetical protein [Pseudomonadota bacterium]